MTPIRFAADLLRAGEITVVKRRGLDVVSTRTVQNLITDAGLDYLASALTDGRSIELNRMAWGDDATAVLPVDSTLGNELGRKQITSQSIGPAVGVANTGVYLSPDEANGDIEEFGWFIGGTNSPNSGTLFARVLYSDTKTAGLESYDVQRTDTTARV